MATVSKAFQKNRKSSSYYAKIRTLFWLASVYYVFPVPLSIAALVVAYRDGIISSGLIVMTNTFVSVIGAALASIWSANTSPQPDSTTGLPTAMSGSMHFNSCPSSNVSNGRFTGAGSSRRFQDVTDSDKSPSDNSGLRSWNDEDTIPLPTLVKREEPTGNSST